jgi:hypothetical protein
MDIDRWRRDPENTRWAHELIRELWKAGSVEFTAHAQREMREDSLDRLDVENIIRFGRIVEVTQPKEMWRYRIEGAAVDGRRAAVVVEIGDDLIVVTAFVLGGK